MIIAQGVLMSLLSAIKWREFKLLSRTGMMI